MIGWCLQFYGVRLIRSIFNKAKFRVEQVQKEKETRSEIYSSDQVKDLMAEDVELKISQRNLPDHDTHFYSEN